jgi:hypothetical protein
VCVTVCVPVCARGRCVNAGMLAEEGGGGQLGFRKELWTGI